MNCEVLKLADWVQKGCKGFNQNHLCLMKIFGLTGLSVLNMSFWNILGSKGLTKDQMARCGSKGNPVAQIVFVTQKRAP